MVRQKDGMSEKDFPKKAGVPNFGTIVSVLSFLKISSLFSWD